MAGSGGDGQGGGFYESTLGISGQATLTINACLVLANAAGGGAGGGNGQGGGVFVDSGTTATLNDSSLDGNAAFGGAGVAGNGGDGQGGGVYVAAGGSVRVTRGTITHNVAEGGEGQGGADGQGVGGGVYNLGTFTFDVFTVIAHNHASTSNDDTFGV